MGQFGHFGKLGSWIYIFSKFTPEALLFESFLIFTLCASYAAFWVLRKRRLGSVEDTVPAGIAKTYLNDLIWNAEQIRLQLFGLLASAGIPISDPGKAMEAVATLRTISIGDGDLTRKLQDFEKKVADQAAAMQQMEAEKARIVRELETTKASGAPGAASSGDTGKFEETIQILEAKLAEYSIIEDDLANLKRLQQENAQLRAALGGNAPAPLPAAEAPQAAPSDPVPAAEAPATEEPNFESLVDKVETSLQKEPVLSAEAASPLEVLPTESIETAPSETKPATAMEKSDADLVAEFEKMLNG